MQSTAFSLMVERENKVPTICDMASIIRQAHHNAPLSHRWLSEVEAISLGTLIYCCSLNYLQRK
jgi:hypothetical protein